jgi:predicted nucleic acid-binding protein
VILDAEGLVKLAGGDRDVLSLARDVHDRDGSVVTAASTIAEVLRGSPRDAAVHRVLNTVTVVAIGRAHGRLAGELLGLTGLPGRCAMDALLAAVALSQPRPAILVTSDPDDLAKLTEEPHRPRAERIAIVRA